MREPLEWEVEKGATGEMEVCPKKCNHAFGWQIWKGSFGFRRRHQQLLYKRRLRNGVPLTKAPQTLSLLSFMLTANVSSWLQETWLAKGLLEAPKCCLVFILGHCLAHVVLSSAQKHTERQTSSFLSYSTNKMGMWKVNFTPGNLRSEDKMTWPESDSRKSEVRIKARMCEFQFIFLCITFTVALSSLYLKWLGWIAPAQWIVVGEHQFIVYCSWYTQILHVGWYGKSVLWS